MERQKQRRRQATEAQPVQWTLDQALEYIQRKHLALYYTDDRDGGSSPVDLWSGGVKVPIGVRRQIFQHRFELLAMMRAGSVLTCVSPAWHQRYWRRDVCRLCACIEASMAPERTYEHEYQQAS